MMRCFAQLLLLLALVLPGVVPPAVAQDDVPEVVRTRLEEAERARQAGRLDEALARAEEARKLGPHVVDVYLTLGALHHAQGDLEASLASFEAGLEQDPEERNLLYNAAVLALRLGQAERTVAYVERALRRQRNDTTLLSLQSAAFSRLGRSEEAFQALDKAWKQDRKNPQILFSLGNLHHQLGRPEEAIESYRRAIREDADMLRAHYNLGAVLFEQERDQEALEAYQVALEPIRAELRRGEEVEAVHGQAFSNLGAIYLRQGDWAQALDAYDVARSLDGELAGVEASRGFLLFQLDRPDESLLAYERAEAEAELPPLAYFHLGRIHYGRGELDRAVARLEPNLDRLEEARKLEAWRLLAVSQQALGQRAEASQAWRQVLERSPDDVPAMFALGRLLRQEGRAEEARPLLEQVRERSPGHRGATLELAALAQAAGRREEERGLYEAVLASGPADGLWAVELRLALLLVREGELDEARSRFDSLAALSAEGGPGEEERRLIGTLRGALRMQEGNRGAARAALEEVSSGPGSPAGQALAVLAAGEGRGEEALGTLRSAVQSHPSPLAQANLGQLLWSLGRFDEAEPHLRAAAEGLPRWPSLRAALGDLALRRGRLPEAAAEFEIASDRCGDGTGPEAPLAPAGVFTTVLADESGAEEFCEWVRANLGRALVGMSYGDLNEALRRGGSTARRVRSQATQALDLSLSGSLRATALFVRGSAALALGEVGAATRDLRAALDGALDPSLKPTAESNLGVALARNGEAEGARTLWASARQASRPPAAAGLNLGILLDEQGGAGREALAFYEEYLRSGGPRRQEVEGWVESLRRIYR